MKTFVWPSSSQNTRSSFDWNNIKSVLNNNYNRTSNRSKWSFEEEQPEYRSASTPSIDPDVEKAVELGKATLPAAIYEIKTKSGLTDREIIVAFKAVLTGYRSIAEANMTARLDQLIEQATGFKAVDQFNLTDKQKVQAIDLIVEFLNSKL